MKTWACVACGKCCLGYRVPLKADEYARVTRFYGYNVVEFGIGKAYLKLGVGNRCVFQRPSVGRSICSLQKMKPLACKLFPFRIMSKPLYKRGDTSEYNFYGRNFYVYMDPECDGIVIGRPNKRFLYDILPEVIQIGVGVNFKQKYTTSKYFL